ncbi:AraC family transcriptional regulator [Streptomyces sp. NPDC005917]|uniref:AraC family transcriptional regulator n=1 Tax=unclassified Streptomyces TaxID=2593676 RepID=UPI0033E23644
MPADLAELISRHRTRPRTPSAVPRLRVVALDTPVPPTDVTYTPMICLVARGAKRTVVGAHSRVARAGEMYLNPVTTPVVAVFEEVPYRSAVLHLDARLLADVAADARPSRGSYEPEALGSVQADPAVLDAMTRWVRLLDTPEDIPALAEHREAELLYRLLESPLGAQLCACVLEDSATGRIRQVARWITEHAAEPLRVEDIAREARMSPTSLHRQFRAVMGTSPRRFQKGVRLQDARRRILAEGETATEAATAVGYVSASQFNREYRQVYGLPPLQDAVRIRRHLAGLADAAHGGEPDTTG